MDAHKIKRLVPSFLEKLFLIKVHIANVKTYKQVSVRLRAPYILETQTIQPSMFRHTISIGTTPSLSWTGWTKRIDLHDAPMINLDSSSISKCIN